MFQRCDYQLLDFGFGRKLERFGDYILDRPSPAAENHTPLESESWKAANARYERGAKAKGRWEFRTELPETWPLQHKPFQFQLRPTDFGHVGVFPEQSGNWDWIAKQVQRANRQLNVLNLFAYTGGSTMAAAAAGARVVHVDSAKSTVGWARSNAAAAGLEAAPIRWITEDASRFVQREIKRGHQYDAVILDPPSYGHGPAGETWKLDESLIPLLQGCAKLTSASRAFILLTCHSSGFGPAEAEAYLADAVFGACSAGANAKSLNLKTGSARQLNAGVVARWP